VVSVMAGAGRCGLADLAGEHVRIGSRVGRERAPEGPLPGAGMAAGAGSIDDYGRPAARCHERGVQRHPGPGIRALSTLVSFLRSFTWGNRGAEIALVN